MKLKPLVLGLAFAACTVTAGWAETKPAAKPVAAAPKDSKRDGAPDACIASIIAKRSQAPAPEPAPGSKPPPLSDGEKAFFAYDQGQYITALSLAEAAASRGDPAAHALVARIHDEGLGVPKDAITAARWYARGAELCDVPSLFEYGLMLAQGRGVGKDRVAAAEMLEKAAISGHALANYNLGLIFIKGDGKPENPYRAAQHIRYAAEKGIAAAQYDIAVMYQTGSGVAQDQVEASNWYNKAAAAGFTAAQYDYAVLLLKGLGLERDKAKAVTYLRAAADQGLPGAQNRLANLYFEGVGVEKSLREAAKWRSLSKRAGVVDAALDGEIAKMPASERTAAEKTANDWLDARSIGAGDFPGGNAPPPAPPKAGAAVKPGK